MLQQIIDAGGGQETKVLINVGLRVNTIPSLVEILPRMLFVLISTNVDVFRRQLFRIDFCTFLPKLKRKQNLMQLHLYLSEGGSQLRSPTYSLNKCEHVLQWQPYLQLAATDKQTTLQYDISACSNYSSKQLAIIVPICLYVRETIPNRTSGKIKLTPPTYSHTIVLLVSSLNFSLLI